MSEPNEILSQLLSGQQAETLTATGAHAWSMAAAALAGFRGGAPNREAIDARLVMPEEILKEFDEPHLVAPLELSTDQDQTAMAYVVAPTSALAQFLGSQADNPEDEEQQTIVMASTVAGQVIQALNIQLFGRSSNGLVVALDDVNANSMSGTLSEMDEPCMLLSVSVAGAAELPLRFVLPGTFLDITASAMADAVAMGMDSEDESPFELTQEDLEAAELLEEEEPVLAAVGRSGAGGQAGAGLSQAPTAGPREPTPISPAASRARFAPLPEPETSGRYSGIDLLAGLQMNVSVELGRTELTVAEVLGLGPGSVIELDRLAGEPVDILVNERLIARGEVVVVDENFGVRVVEVVRRGNDIEERAG